MARISLGLCLMLVIASSVIYEAQGTFLLRHFLRKIPRKSSEVTPFASQGMITFMTNLEGACPATPEFKTFFTEFKSYVVFIDTASASDKNIDAEMQTKCDGLFKAMSTLSSGKGAKSEDAGGLKATLLSMGKTLIEMKKNAVVLSLEKKKELIISMVKWTKSLATFLKGASEKKGKTINITTYELDVDVNDKSILGGETTETGSSSSTKTSGSVSGGAFKDTTGQTSGSPSGSPKANPSGSAPVGSVTGGATQTSSGESQTKSSSQSSSSGSSSTSVKQVESETSKETMGFIMELEKKYSTSEELKMFFEKLKASMQACSSVGSKTAKDYVSATSAATGKLNEAMALVSSRNVKSAKVLIISKP